MKILLVSIASPHFFRWTEQLEKSGHEIYWFDIRDTGERVKRLDFIKQIIGWRYRLNYPKRYWVKKHLPLFNSWINKFNERSLIKTFEKQIKTIQPDVVHSFVMYLGTAPFLEVMKKNRNIKWIYSSWGSDLYYYSKLPREGLDIRGTLPNIHYMFSDCYRDYNFALANGFKGKFLGVFPGGGGYELNTLANLIKETKERNVILIKGYHGLHGRCIEVLKAVIKLKSLLASKEILVFGAGEQVNDFIRKSNLESWRNFKSLGLISHRKVMELMGESLIYIGNSRSDGMPNTLLEAIIMGAFPIQSDPGGATSEIIIDGFNGLTIPDPEDVVGIAGRILKSLTGEIDIRKGIQHNLDVIRPKLERDKIREEVLKKYALVELEQN